LSDSGEERTIRVRIEGRVQGVGYRYWTERTAIDLELSGWVRNLRDGSVEAVFSGDPAKVEAMIQQCSRGPRSAMVAALSIEDEADVPPSGFQMLPTG
jgi:acylphosphatase